MLPFSFINKDAERAYRDLMDGLIANDGAECASYPDIFFPNDWDMGTRADDLFAKTVCGRCPLQQLCLEYALIEDEHGTWGGLTAHERRQLKGLSRN